MKKIFFIWMLIVGSVSGIYAAKNDALPSLCDEWKILSSSVKSLSEVSFTTYTRRLTTDTIIGDMRYVKMEEDGSVANGKYDAYVGAFREDENANIYYIPAESEHEYLLYAFNAQVGDKLTNVWFGGSPSWFPEGCNVTITDITDTEPRVFKLVVEYSSDDETTSWNDYVWIEGVGMLEAPNGDWCPFDCAGDGSEHVLCAYKNGEQVYVSEYGEEYGCEYNAESINVALFHAPNLEEWDEITGVNSSSRDTLTKVDSKNALVVLNGHYLMIWNKYYSSEEGGEMEMQLISLADNRVVESEQFASYKELHIQTPGSYMIVLKVERVEGILLGRLDFEVSPQAIELPASSSDKVRKSFRDGQLFIQRGEKVYTVTGQEVK